MAELVKGFNRAEHELALAGEAKSYGAAVANQKKKCRLWMLVGCVVMVAVGIWLR